MDRRAVLFGAAFAALAGGSAAPVLACSREAYSPLESKFWGSLWARTVSAPRQERRLAERLLEAIAYGSADRLDRLLAPGALLFRPPDGTPHWSRPARRYDRGEAIEQLSAYVARDGQRSITLDHFGSFLPHSQFLLQATLEGYGDSTDKPIRGYGLCGEDPKEWQRKLVLAYRTEAAPLGHPLRAETILWLH